MLCPLHRRLLAFGELLLAGCAAASVPKAQTVPPGEPDSILCALYHVDAQDGDPGYQVLLKPGMDNVVEVGGLRLNARYEGSSRGEAGAFGLSVHAGDVMLFRTLFQLPAGHLPANQYLGDHGFTGLIYLTHPTQGGNYQALCKSVDSRSLARTETREQFLARTEAETARKSARVAALHERTMCTLTPEQTRAGERCPPKHPLAERTQAILTLHAAGERSFAEVDLQGAELSHADLRECDLTAARFDGAQLQGASLYFSRLERAVLRGAQLQAANLYSAQLAAADLSDAKAEGVSLESAELGGARLVSADLSGANLRGASLSSADLSGARLVSAELSSANLTGAKLTGANLGSATLAHAVLDGSDLSAVQQLDQRQLDLACGDAKTTLPSGFRIRREPRPEVHGLAVRPCGG